MRQDEIRSRQDFLKYADQESRAFLKGKRHVIHYSRGPERPCGVAKDRQPIMGPGCPDAVFLAYQNQDGKVQFGWSAVHPIREHNLFSKVEGRYRAIGRSQLTWGHPRYCEIHPRLRTQFIAFAIRAIQKLNPESTQLDNIAV